MKTRVELAHDPGDAGATQGPRRRGGGRWGFLASLPGIGATLLPVGICPACWPAYAGLLGALGLGPLLESSYLFPLTAALLGLALFSLAYRARTRRGYGPLGVGIVAVATILISKFVIASDPLLYAGLTALVIASVWNSWPRRKTASIPCPRCVSDGMPTIPAS